AGIFIGTALLDPGPVFLFPGQGAQWPGMGLTLLEDFEAFRARLAECAAALDPHIDRPLMEILSRPEGDPVWQRADCVQPALFAIAVSLAELWRSFGVEPAAVVGHSIGDVAAAVVAGALPLDEGARVSALWAKAQQAIPTPGAMAVVELTAAELEQRLLPWQGRIDMGGANGPRSSIASGDDGAVGELLGELAAEGVRAKPIEVPFAAHSRQLRPVLGDLVGELGAVDYGEPGIPFYAAVDGRPRRNPELDASYWAQSISRPVRFEEAVGTALADGWRAFVEVGPHPILTVPMREMGEGAGAAVLGTVVRGDESESRMLAALVEAHVAGVPVDWERVFGPRGLQPLDLREAGLEEAQPVEVATPAAAGEDLALRFVRVEVASLLGSAEPGDFDPTARFADLGLDSAAATTLANRLAQATGVRLPASAIYDHPTAERLARHVAALQRGETIGVAAPVRMRGDSREPIAIVGIGCRFPGGVASPEGLWELLERGGNAIGPFPTDRGWDPASLYDPDPDSLGKTYCLEGGFLDGATDFDASFFGISPREALAMDPQQRLLLECAWEALERAGIDPTALAGESAGVFAGFSHQDYGPGLRPEAGGDRRDRPSPHRLTGTLTSLLSGRLAYSLGVEGPAVSVDTACSASLVATHLAAASLRSGECDLALAGGVTVMATAGMFLEFSQQRGLAPDGRAKAFSAAADGTVFSEGAGLLVLERLSDAEANGHRPLALIRGSATNQDGASNGLTAPNGPSQERVIAQALANSGLGPADVDAVEAHGTGTTLGD
ncbi:MAG TPA: beta-ketoacyl synthase N-terminal-like domain-containing protein, partial [Solirubrobacterales bacterium]|nr:beta-ketoacyl synthase N-terminal-like domain-containing protein [Solirubrobacterales bacterium]